MATKKESIFSDLETQILKKYGIHGTTDAEVRPQVLEILKLNDVEEVDNDPLGDLITILDAFAVIKPKTGKKETGKKVVAEEDDAEETEEEDEVPVTEEEVIPKKTKKVEKEKTKVVAEKPKKDEKVKSVKETVPAKKEEKKVVAKVETKPAKKVVKAESKEELDELVAEAKDTKPEKAAKKEEKKAAKEKQIRGNTNQYDGENEDHVKRLKVALKDVLKLKSFTLTYSKARVTGRVEGSVSGRTLFSIEQIRFKGDKINLSIVYTGMNLFKSNQDVADYTKTFLGEAEQDMIVCENNAYPRVRSIPATDLTKFMTQKIIDTIVERINKLDGTLNNNRKKMQQKIED